MVPAPLAGRASHSRHSHRRGVLVFVALVIANVLAGEDIGSSVAPLCLGSVPIPNLGIAHTSVLPTRSPSPPPRRDGQRTQPGPRAQNTGGTYRSRRAEIGTGGSGSCCAETPLLAFDFSFCKLRARRQPKPAHGGLAVAPALMLQLCPTRTNLLQEPRKEAPLLGLVRVDGLIPDLEVALARRRILQARHPVPFMGPPKLALQHR